MKSFWLFLERNDFKATCRQLNDWLLCAWLNIKKLNFLTSIYDGQYCIQMVLTYFAYKKRLDSDQRTDLNPWSFNLSDTCRNLFLWDTST